MPPGGLIRAAAALGAAALVVALPAAAAGEPVHPRLPWHAAVLDGTGKLLAWHEPRRGGGYDHVLRLGWSFLERGVPRDRRTGLPVYLVYGVFDGPRRQGVYFQHSPAIVYGTMVDSLVAWYPYSGDRRAIGVVRRMLDYQLRHGTTPAGWAWPRVPFPSSCAGDRRYGRCLAGLPAGFHGGIEPDKVGLLGYAYAQFYELTGERRFLRAAVRAGDALARHVRPGDAGRTPWPFRVHGRTGRVLDGARYGGAVVTAVRLFDELIRLRAGRVDAYARARDLAWGWILRHPLNPDSPAFNRWSGFYQDVPHLSGNRNQVPPTFVAHYLLTHPDPGSVDPAWQAHVRALLRWVRASFPRGPFHGAWGIDEQRAPGRRGCCSVVGLGSTTSRWAALKAMFSARTGDRAGREVAFRSLNFATYFARRDGRIACCGVRPHNTYWFSDGYGDYLRHFNWAMAAVPEWAPRGENHLLGSTSVVQAVAYGRLRVAYRTSRARAEETLRLRFRPRRVLAGSAALPLLPALTREGYTVRRLPGGDVAVHIRHDRARRVQVVG